MAVDLKAYGDSSSRMERLLRLSLEELLHELTPTQRVLHDELPQPLDRDTLSLLLLLNPNAEELTAKLRGWVDRGRMTVAQHVERFSAHVRYFYDRAAKHHEFTALELYRLQTSPRGNPSEDERADRLRALGDHYAALARRPVLHVYDEFGTEGIEAAELEREREDYVAALPIAAQRLYRQLESEGGTVTWTDLTEIWSHRTQEHEKIMRLQKLLDAHRAGIHRPS